MLYIHVMHKWIFCEIGVDYALMKAVNQVLDSNLCCCIHVETNEETSGTCSKKLTICE